MLQDIRKSTQGTTAKIIVGLIVVAFAGFGIESILVGSGSSGVAEVNGEDISPQELQQAVNNQKRRLISMLGDNLDPAMLDDQRLTAQAMESLVQRKLMTQSAADMKLVISERQVGAVIGTMEQFQVDGQFSPEMYRASLSNAGFTPTSFKQTLQEDMVMGQVRSGLSGSEFATPAEMELNARIAGEQRDLRYLTIPIDHFLGQRDIDDTAIEAYYESNSSNFFSREAVELDYIELNSEDFAEPVAEDSILAAYEQATQDLQYQTENRVSHILFEQANDETADALVGRIAQARSKLAEGADFADVAREFSDDIGSASAGGDLGFTSGTAFPEEMEAAISELDVAVVSEPVETEAGTHLILVTERRDGEAPGLEEMRAQLEQGLQMAEARVTMLRTVETLKDLAFNADGLEGPASELALQLKHSEKVTRSQEDGLFANASLLAAAFSDDVLNSGHNSEVIELGGDSFVVLRVRAHHPSEVKPLPEVREQIMALVTEERARDAVQGEAEKAVAALRSGVSVESFATGAGYEWQVELGADRRNQVVPGEVLSSAFSLAPPGEGESTVERVMTASGDALVYQLARVTPGQLQSLPEAEQAALEQLVGGEFANLVADAYQRGLRDSADITVL